jgi:hypothetical protein
LRYLSIIIFLLLNLYATGQVLKGTVVEGETGNPIVAVVVANLTTQRTSYTDSRGAFTISAKKGDQVTFSFVGYKPQQKTVPSALGAAEMYIELFRMSYQLEEFTLRRRYTPYQMDSIERKSTYSRALAREKGGSIMSPVTFIAEKLSRQSKQVFRFQKSFNYWEEVKFIESRYSPDIVRSLTGLSGDTLARFMNSNPMPGDYARAASDLEIKIWIREQFKAWQSSSAPSFTSSPLVPGTTVDKSQDSTNAGR